MAKKVRTIGQQLQNAAESGDLSKVDELLVQLDFRREKRDLDLALRWAAWGGHLDVTGRLIKAGADLHQELIGQTLLEQAASRGRLPVVKLLLASGAGGHGKSVVNAAYSAAMEAEHTDVTKFLKSKGADWATPTLYFASAGGDLKVVRRALAAGADLEVVLGEWDETPLMAAARMGHTDVVRCLLKAGADPNRKAHEMTALFSAVGNGKKPEIVEALIKAGADIDQRYHNETILMGAAKGGNLPIVQRLVGLGADIHARDRKSGRNVMDHARDGKSKAVIEYLRDHGVAAEREAGRALARALAREFGGNVQEHAGGRSVITTAFLLDTRIAGWKSQFDIGAEGFVVELYGLPYRAAELRQTGRGKVTIKPRQAATARAAGGKIEVRTLGKMPQSVANMLLQGHVKRLCRLGLAGKERLELGDSSARLIGIGSDPAAAITRLKELAAFLREVCGAPTRKRRLFDREWLIKPMRKAATDSSASRHCWGGDVNPSLSCPHCGHALSRIAAIDLGDAALPRSPLGKRQVPVFWCFACAYWEPTFFDLSGASPRTLGKKRKTSKISAALELTELEPRTLALVPALAGKKVGRKSKLGGDPAWVQNDESPECPKCRKEMAFFLQIASDSQVTFADMGLLYAFVCPECRVTASLVQSH